MTIALLLALLAGGQADPSQSDIACVTAQVSLPGADAFIAEVSGEGDRPIRESFRAAAARCAGERNWSPEYSGSIEQLAAAQLLLPIVRERLTAGGIHVEVVDEWLVSTSFRPGSDPALAEAEWQRLEGRLHAAGSAAERVEANSELIGVYIGAQHAVVEARRALARASGNPGWS